MEMENNEDELRSIDHDLVEDGIEMRAQLLDEFLAERLEDFKVGLVKLRQKTVSRQAVAEVFGRLLVKAAKDMVDDERQHKLKTNWNRAEEEQEVCRRTAALGRDYYLASPAERTAVTAKCLSYFSRLPMPLEELAYEERAVRSPSWDKDVPIEDRRIYVRLEKGFPRLSPAAHYGNLSPDAYNGSQFPRRAAEPQRAGPEQTPPRTPARKRFAEIRRSKSRR